MTKKYTREDRYRVAALLFSTGNSMEVFRETGIPASTIRYWAHNDEDFQLMCQEIRAEFDDKIKYKYVQIIDESTDQVLDRLRNGDVMRDNKTGELIRVPVKAKEAAIIGAIVSDKLRLAENQPTTIVQHESVEQARKRLLDHFRAIANAVKSGDQAAYDKLERDMGGTPTPLAKKGEDKEDQED